MLIPHETYLSLGVTEEARQQAYRKLFELHLSRPMIDKIRESTHACRVLGNDKFTEQIEAMLQRRLKPARRGRPRKAASS